MTDPDPARIAEAVAGCPEVVALSGGLFGEVATYLPGRRLTGVQVHPASVVVHVVARYGPALSLVADQVRSAVGALTDRPIEVVIDDLEVPAELRTRPAPAGPVPR